MESTADGLNSRYTTTTQSVGSRLITGGSLTTITGHDTTLVDATVKAGGNVTTPDVNNLLTNEADVMNAANEGARVAKVTSLQDMSPQSLPADVTVS